ncbi:hypothetical protein Micbo1qcDRAFT_236923 [Microdochium bolleyi]|uniref:Rhodopsin domain-containing protein n=1 Tax=Microdochium bolleyi TaxID=196109 RepID=A0A136IN59_9PEZI|nr:hypothetical protein Micbo1qcDRAFT_236923 [Microdochium bolleyi]
MENRGPTLLVLNSVFMVLMLWSHGLRMWVRLGVVKSWGWDDSLMTVAVILYGTYLSFSIHGAVHGTGRHFDDVPLEQYMIAMKSWWICYPFYSANMIASKLSIGYFLLRVSVRRLHIWLLYIIMAITMMAGLAFFIGSFVQCQPLSYWWTRYRDPAGGYCIDPTIIIALAYIYSFFAITSDLMMALFPALLISSLNMDRQIKLMLIPLMAMGTIASLGLVVRLPWLLKLRDVDDFLWSTIDIAIWSTVESGLAIVAGNLATTRPLYRHLMQRFGFTQRTGTVGPSGPTASGRRYGGYNISKSSRKNRSEGGGGGGGAGSSGSFGRSVAGVFGGSAGAYPLSDIDDGEYGRGSDDKNDSKSSATNHSRNLSASRLTRHGGNHHHLHKPSSEVITTTTTISNTVSDAADNPSSRPRTDSSGLYHNGLPYGLRTQIVAGEGGGPSESQEELYSHTQTGRSRSFTRQDRE